MLFWLLFSFFLVAFGQPAWVPGFGLFAGCLGFALFWRSMFFFPRARDRFLLAILWFGAVQGIQLSWMTSTLYMGPLILFVYLFLLLGLGIQFACLSFLVQPPLDFRRCLAIAGVWVCFEWVRLYFLTGFTWNPVGLALVDSPLSLQWASLFGIYGLSFWVILVNLTALKAFFLEKTKRNIAIWAFLALLPYGYGFLHLHWIERSHPSSKNLSVALVQTGLLPEQKDYQKRYAHVFIPPLEQWERILRCLKEEKKVDLIVLPEASFPYGAYRDLFPFHLVKAFWIDFFGEEAIRDFPPIQAPFGNSHSVNNTFLAQALANHFQADVILGLDDHDLKKDAKYNAAFYFSPQGNSPVRYEKRVLVPATEYVPLKSWKFIARFLREEFGIGDAFEPGTEVKIFQACIPIGVSICIEEIYSGLTRDLRKSGAELFVNLSNDVWFPSSRLPQQHFDHGRVRAVENGVYIVRACNTGITGGVDCFGRPLACLPVSETKAEALYLSLPIRSYHTLYTWWGDQAILGFSVLSIAFGFLGRKKKLP